METLISCTTSDVEILRLRSLVSWTGFLIKGCLISRSSSPTEKQWKWRKHTAASLRPRLQLSSLRLVCCRTRWRARGGPASTRRPRLRCSSPHMMASDKAAILTWGQRSGAANALCRAGMRAYTCFRMCSWALSTAETFWNRKSCKRL